MGTIYIGIIMICRVLQHIFNKKVSNGMGGLLSFLKYNSFSCLVSASFGLLLILFAGNGFACDFLTVIISITSGVMLVLSTVFSLLALKSGTVALVSLAGTAGLLVPCIAGIFLFNEPMSLGQWGGVLLLFIAAYFLILSSSLTISFLARIIDVGKITPKAKNSG